MSPVPAARSAALLLLVGALGAGCGSGDDAPVDPAASPQPPVLGQRGDDEQPNTGVLGLPTAATKNTTRVGGSDSASIAAAVSLAVHPPGPQESRPAAVTLVDQAKWAGAISAAQLGGPEVRAPVLLVDGEQVPRASADALALLRPTGIRSLGGAQAIRAGTPAQPSGARAFNVEGTDPAALARSIDALHTRILGEPTRSVVVAPLDAPPFAMPAAGWAAKSGDPVLWTTRDALPADTLAAIRAREDPRIYVLGPPDVIPASIVRRLERLGRVERIHGPDPIRNAIAFARFSDRDFGWGVVDPGHGLVFSTSARPADAAAASTLSASGSHAPLLLVEGPELPAAVIAYLLDIQPGYESDPVRGVYNHGWLMGDATTISVPMQSRIDSLLEIQPVDPSP